MEFPTPPLSQVRRQLSACEPESFPDFTELPNAGSFLKPHIDQRGEGEPLKVALDAPVYNAGRTSSKPRPRSN